MTTPPPSDPPDTTRRRWFFAAGATALGAGFAGGVAATAELLWPTVSYEPPRRYAVGRPETLPFDRPTFLPEHRLFVLNRGDGFAAVSAVCTHLGCTVRHVEGEGFVCPCHGSRFDLEGQVRQGPAPGPLPWYGLSLSRRGDLIVDERHLVDPGYRFLA
ncbi:MAG: ubiquinol-cytochrome c reductase iron-sulfur subunit [Vicinamibacteria bacterium]|nr:ubiquinol-cytochrome c reductase iron-sulfur subunit [Vicinamibacteria bacterium]